MGRVQGVLVACLAWVGVGEAAQRTVGVAGFSPDGRFFAFEEFGREATLGHAVADLFVIDTEADRWIAGTPLRRVIERSDALVEDARAILRRDAAPFLNGLRTVEEGRTLARFDAPPGAGARMAAAILPGFGAVEMRVRDVPATRAAHCPNVEAVRGYAIDVFQGETRTTLATSDAIPRSRGCPSTHALVRVLVHESAERRVLAVVLAVEEVLPSGASTRRHITVARRLP